MDEPGSSTFVTAFSVLVWNSEKKSDESPPCIQFLLCADDQIDLGFSLLATTSAIDGAYRLDDGLLGGVRKE
jgi:hypothetical protein